MSYISLLKNIPAILIQPTGIAAIASFGMHGAVALIVPLMPVNANNSPPETNLLNTVGVVELSPSDQQGLPQDPTQVAVLPQNPLAQQLPPGQVTPNQGSTTVFTPGIRSLPTRQGLRVDPNSNRMNISSLPPQFRFSRGFNAKQHSFKQTTRQKTLPPITPGLSSQAAVSNSGYQSSGPSQNLIDPTTLPSTPLNSNTSSGNQSNVPFSLGSHSTGESAKVVVKPIGETPLPSGNKSPLGVDQQNSSTYQNLKALLNRDFPGAAPPKKIIRETITTAKSDQEGNIWGLFVLGTDGKISKYYLDKSTSPQLQEQAKKYLAQNPPQGNNQVASYQFNLNFRNDSGSTAQNQTPPSPPANDAKKAPEENTSTNSSVKSSGTPINLPTTPDISTSTSSADHRRKNDVVIPNPKNENSPSTKSTDKVRKKLLQWKEENTQSHQNR